MSRSGLDDGGELIAVVGHAAGGHDLHATEALLAQSVDADAVDAGVEQFGQLNLGIPLGDAKAPIHQFGDSPVADDLRSIEECPGQ